MVRVLRQVAENTVYTFAMLLAVYLVGTAAGAAAYQRWLAPHAKAERLRDRLLLALALACLLGTAEPVVAPKTSRPPAAARRRRAGSRAVRRGRRSPRWPSCCPRS